MHWCRQVAVLNSMINEQSEFMQSRIMLAVLLIPHCHQLLQLMRHYSEHLNTTHS